MPIAIWCVLVAAILPLVAIFPGKLSKDYDNANPRDPAYWSDPFRSRCRAAQLNGFEGFPFFAAAVIIAIGQGADSQWINNLAELYIGLRVIYTLCYLANRPSPRSLAWIAGFATTIAIFTSPVWS